MSHGHSHAHPHGPRHGTTAGEHRRRLVIVVLITGAVFLAEVVGGLLSGSLALLADAGHMLTDSAALLIALIASLIADRPATSRRSFGLERAEILAALINAALLCVIATSVLVSAIQRWNDPIEIATVPMLGVAAVGAVANLAGLLILMPGRKVSLNIKGAYLEMLGDLLGSIAVIIAAIVIMLTGFTRADSIAAIVIFLMIVPRAWSLLREVIEVLLEAAPAWMDPDEIRTHLSETEQVVAVHDLHVWTISSGSPVLTVHVVVEDDVFTTGQAGRLLDRLGECLHDHFELSHVTIQLEPRPHGEHERATHA